MQFFAVATLFVVGVLAAPSPSGLNSRDTLCAAGLYSTPQCCAVDVLGVADLNCAGPNCAAIGQEARCCVLPVLGQDVLCQTPPGL
uniref:Hydrophobin n=1 Tax=Hypocrea atroviridis TaxID=63577 RepID=A7LNW4_HYPAT|nr:hydrophobin [Trichoderma atroviride]